MKDVAKRMTKTAVREVAGAGRARDEKRKALKRGPPREESERPKEVMVMSMRLNQYRGSIDSPKHRRARSLARRKRRAASKAAPAVPSSHIPSKCYFESSPSASSSYPSESFDVCAFVCKFADDRDKVNQPPFKAFEAINTGNTLPSKATWRLHTCVALK